MASVRPGKDRLSEPVAAIKTRARKGLFGFGAGSDGAAGRLPTTMAAIAAHLLLWCAAAWFLFPVRGLATHFFRVQDLPALVFIALTLLALALYGSRLPALRLPDSPRWAALIALVMVLFAATGTWLVFGGFPLSRDEVMADFDARFLAHGRLIAPVAGEWAPYSRALMPLFMLDVPSSVGWMSAYLPGNAALRAVGIATLGPEWVNPILAALSLVATYRIGRRLWPDDREPAIVAVLLMGASAQLIATAMTAYAMTAHLAFNLLWLWAFLRGDRKGDAAAIAAGFVATGLHQIIFHPLFVLPFIYQLWRSGSRGRVIAYIVAYGAIGLFWSAYWQLVLASAGAQGPQAAAGGLSYLASRLVSLLASVDPGGAVVMVLNLLRFVSWQHVLLVPLTVLAWPAVRRGEGIARPLAAGIALTIAAMLLLLPWQGHGWGYRYLHGLIGSFSLLGGYGWLSLGREHKARAAILAAGTAASLLVLLPLHLKQAHDFARPYREAQAMINASDADLVFVDPAGVLYGEDLVRNLPDLSNRPVVMELEVLTAAEIRHLCTSRRVALFDVRHARLAHVHGQGVPSEVGEASRERQSLIKSIGCGRPLPIG